MFWVNTTMEITQDHNLEKPQTVAELPSRALADVAKIKHIQSDDVYIKTYFVPQGMKLYTKQFPNEHVSILAHGSVVVNDNGVKTRFVAPAHYVFPANRRVSIITLENAVWYCVHPTDVTDLETLQELY